MTLRDKQQKLGAVRDSQLFGSHAQETPSCMGSHMHCALHDTFGAAMCTKADTACV